MAAGGADLCSPSGGARSISVRTVEWTSRLPPYGSRFTVKINVCLRIESDYLFIGSGREMMPGLDAATALAGKAKDFEQLVRSVSTLGTGLQTVKDFYRARNPHAGGAYQPAVPGSSLKGAVRSRIELGSCGCQADSVVGGFLYDDNRGPPRGIPRGVPGWSWRHVMVWCESIWDVRRKPSQQQYMPSIVEDLFGVASQQLTLGSRVFFGTFYPTGVREDFDCQIVRLDHDERVCAVPRGTVFCGEILAVNVSVEDLGLIFYGLGLDKLLCGKRPRILLGYSKYRRRGEERRLRFGVVEVEVRSINPAPWSRDAWEGWARGRPIGELVREAVSRALESYPDLRKCLDEVERVSSLQR